MQPGSGQSGNNSSAMEAKEKKAKKKRNRKKDGLTEGATEEAMAGGTTGGSSQGKESCAKREERRESGTSSGGEGSDRASSLTTAVFGRDEVVSGASKGAPITDEQFEMAMQKFAKRLEAHCSEVVSQHASKLKPNYSGSWIVNLQTQL